MSSRDTIIVDGNNNNNGGNILSTMAATLSSSSSSSSNLKFSAQDVVTDLVFLLLIIGTITFVFWQPQIFGSLEFYRSCFKTKRKGCATERSKMTPPSPLVFSIIWKIVHACEVAAFIVFIYNYRFPSSTDETNKYVAIEALFISMILLEKLWVECFWNFHHLWAPLLFTGIISFILIGLSIALLVLFAIIGATSSVSNIAYASMGLMILPVIWYCIGFIWNCIVIRCYIWKDEHCHCHKQRKTYATSYNVKIKESENEGGEEGNQQEMTEVNIIDQQHHHHHQDYYGHGGQKRHKSHHNHY